MSAVDLDQLVAVVRGLAEQHPQREASDHYIDGDGHPVCIIGHAFVVMGLRDRIHEGSAVRALPGIDPSDKRSMWLEEVQEGQDGGKTWAVAVAVADYNIPIGGAA
jgi:hypothetical protein